jgi:hypothetical protein
VTLSRRIRVASLRAEIDKLVRSLDLGLAEAQVAETDVAYLRAFERVGEALCAISTRLYAFASPAEPAAPGKRGDS